jgi:hypothetical protein
MMQKCTTFTTIFRVKKCHFHYDFACKKSATFITICKKRMFIIILLRYLKLHCLIVNYAKPGDHIGNCAKEYVGTGLETCI